jgi:hypothetical protein
MNTRANPRTLSYRVNMRVTFRKSYVGSVRREVGHVYKGMTACPQRKFSNSAISFSEHAGAPWRPGVKDAEWGVVLARRHDEM